MHYLLSIQMICWGHAHELNYSSWFHFRLDSSGCALHHPTIYMRNLYMHGPIYHFSAILSVYDLLNKRIQMKPIKLWLILYGIWIESNWDYSNGIILLCHYSDAIAKPKTIYIHMPSITEYNCCYLINAQVDLWKFLTTLLCDNLISQIASNINKFINKRLQCIS